MFSSNNCIATSTPTSDTSLSNLDSLYCSHLWSDSNLRKAVINRQNVENTMIKYCYTCRGKIRKYEIKSPSPDTSFIPKVHSTPDRRQAVDGLYSNIIIQPENEEEISADVSNRYIPSISLEVESSLRQKYTASENQPIRLSRHRKLKESLKGIGCIVSLALTDSRVKKRTQIQACSISVMIVAILVISFVLVNFNSSPFVKTKIAAVPIRSPHFNATAAVTSPRAKSQLKTSTDTIFYYTTTVEPLLNSIDNNTKSLDVIAKIRSNLKTFSKNSKANRSSILSDEKPKEINNRDLSFKFCSCQSNEVCILDEVSGTAVCKKALDPEDPTGCGGLCALETEACQVVDRARGVRVCRLLSATACSAHEWRCRNGFCVEAAARCDGAINCYDHSDEMHCDCDLTKQFRCGHSISCFPNSKLCDGVIDCWDAFDEVNCTSECPDDQFTCTDGQCILSSRFCDGLADCADRTDEPHGCDGECGKHEMLCDNKRCVPRSVACDGVDNCGDASDERHCHEN